MTRLLAACLLALACSVALASCGGGDSGRADLAFVSSRDGDYAIFTMTASGGHQRRLTKAEGVVSQGESVFFQIDPAWSPDGAKIAFGSGRSGSSDVYVMNADGTGTTQLTSGKDNDTHPTWSPDGNRIAFVRAGDIYVMKADGSDLRRISDIDAEEADPAWSPDGSLLAYTRRTPGGPIRDVWVMRPDGSGRRALTRQNGRAFTPSWSPDSTRIVFSSNAKGEVFALYTVGIDAKGVKSVVPTAGDNFEPSWSPDGTKIAYQEDGAIFTVELGGGDVQKLTDNETNDSSPAWKPLSPGE